MLSDTVENEKVSFIRSKSILTLCGNIWLTSAIKTIDKNNTKKLKFYKRVQPEHLNVEQPSVLKEDHFISCLEDRLNGSLFIDKKINYLTFDQFLDNSTPMAGYDEIVPANSVYKDISVNGLDPDKYNLTELLSDSANFSEKSMYWLAKDVDDSWVILYDCVDDKIDFDDLVTMIFREYDFENITLSLYESGDTEYPNAESIEGKKYDCGVLTLSDRILKEKTLTFKVYNLPLLHAILNQKN